MFEIKLQETRVYQEAKEEGRQEGLKQAREKGREQVKFELLPRLLAYGMSMEYVVQLLDLTIEQVRLVSEQESSTPT
ncbi:aspartate aminotransferase [Nostoc sp.]|uniref:aspartate aminotransferase n=1 Tax=Nostoc sp. TaxID=1180 RepID=UPI002FF56B08